MKNGIPEQQRREDFPSETFRYMETQVISHMRTLTMQKAAEHAKKRQPEGDSYTVNIDDVNHGLSDAINDIANKIKESSS